jgi:hypothetical protein
MMFTSWTCGSFTNFIHFPRAKMGCVSLSRLNVNVTYDVLSLTVARNLLYVTHLAPLGS